MPQTRIGGSLRTDLSADILWDDPHEDRFEWRTRFSFFLRHRWSPNWRLFLNLEARHEALFGTDVEADFHLRLDEAFVDGRLPLKRGVLRIRAGNLRHRFGVNLLLSPTDLVNPTDQLRAFLGDGNPRVPVPALLAELSDGPHMVEALIVPFFVPEPRSITGRDFSLLRPGLVDSVIRSAAPVTGNPAVDDPAQDLADALARAVDELDLRARDEGLPLLGIGRRPQAFVFNGDLAVRAKYRAARFDLAVGVFWGNSDAPLYELDPALRAPLLSGRAPTADELSVILSRADELIETRYLRPVTGFAAFSLDAEGFVFSAEAAAASSSVQYRNNLTPWPLPTLTWAAALRWGRGSFQIDAEVQHRWIIGADSSVLGGRAHDWTVAAGVQWRDGRDRLELRLIAAWLPQINEVSLRPGIAYDIRDDLTVSLDATLLFGRWVPLTTLSDFARYTGSAASFYTHNDYLKLGLEYRF